VVEKIAQFKEFLKREQELNDILKESEYGDFALSIKTTHDLAVQGYMKATEQHIIKAVEESMERFLNG
jgi:hypothetical protein